MKTRDQLGLRDRGAAGVIATQVLVGLTTVAIFVVAFVILWRFKVSEPLLVGAQRSAGPHQGAASARDARGRDPDPHRASWDRPAA